MLAGGIVTIVGLAVAVGTLIALHLVPSGLSPARDAVSHYGITRFAAGYRVLTLAMAVSGAGAAGGLAAAFHGRSVIVVLALIVFALARAAISWFPMDEPGGQVSPVGARHVLFALAAFAGILVAAGRLSVVLSRGGFWPSWHAPLLVMDGLLALGMIGLVVARRVPGLRSWFGVIERIYYLGMFAWLGCVGVALVATR